MMKKLLIVAFVLVGFCAYSQERTTVFEKFDNSKAIGIGVTGIATSGNYFNNGYGVSLKSEWPVAQGLSVTGTIGYVRLSYKDFFKDEKQPTTPSTFFPIKAGVRFFLASNLYFEGETGGVYARDYKKDGLFIIELSAGYLMKVSKKGSFDVSLAYQNWSRADNLKLVVLKLAYRAEWL